MERTPRLQVLAQGENFANHDGRARKRLEHAHLPALDALGDFNFAFARKQRHRAHLAQVHAHRVVGFFERAGRQIKFNVFAFFDVFKLLLGRQSFGAFQDIDALGADRGQQIIQVIWGVDITGNQVIDLVIGEISLFFACVDQFFYVVEFIV